MGTKERKQREKEARREEILNAAERVFFEKGLSLATMDEVAEAAELSKGTLYLYYRSKEDLYVALVLRGLEILHTLLENAVSTGGPVIIVLLNFVEAYVEFFKRHRNYFQTFYFLEHPQLRSLVSGEMLDACDRSDRKSWDLVVRTIRQAIDEGMLHRGLDPLEAAVMLWANAHSFLRLIDRTTPYWKEQMGIDLEATLRKSSVMLLEAMMTRAATRKHASLLLHHAGENDPAAGDRES